MDICTVADRQYLRHCTTLLASITHNNPSLDLRFHILCETADENDLRTFHGWCAGRGLDITMHSVSPGDIAMLCDGVIRPAVYYRFLIPELLPHVLTALYLDTDIIVNGALDELLATDVSGVCAAVVRAYYAQHKLHSLGIGDERYFNAGMMLMNLDYWREHRIAEKALRFTVEHPELIPALDQCALNAVLKDQVAYLDPKWNCTRAHAKRYATPNPVVVHYAGRTKPWDRPWKLPYGIFWANFSQMTPWPVDYFGGEKAERRLPIMAKRAAHRIWTRYAA